MINPSGENRAQETLSRPEADGREPRGSGQWAPGQVFIFAIVATVVTLMARLALRGAMGEQAALMIFTLPIMLSAYLGGFRAGLLATGFSCFLAAYYLLPPYHSFLIESAGERWQLLIVALVGVVISGLNEALHRARRRADLAIREHHKAQQALLKAGALQTAIFQSATFSSIATDEKGVIQIFNVGAERMLGYTAADVMNKITPAEISDPRELVVRATALSLELGTPIQPGFEALAFKASRGIEDIYELSYIRKDGTRFPAVVSVTALRDPAGAIIGYLLIGTDNTARQQVAEERKRFEEALQETNIKLEAARCAAEKANLAKSDFLSSMSHELRSPLNAILGFAQLMESASPEPTPLQAKSIAQILQAGWYLLKLINEILDLAVIESGKVSLSKESVSLAELLDECQAMIEPEAQQRRIEMAFPWFAAPVFVSADRTRLKQIVVNLLSNAIKYNQERGAVTVSCTARDPEHIRISVSDTGAGLSPEELAHLFSPFNRLRQEAGTVPGTGIGLVVCKRLAELMGGRIGVESTVGTGSVFWCEMVSAEAPVRSPAAARWGAYSAPKRPSARRRARCFMWRITRRT